MKKKLTFILVFFININYICYSQSPQLLKRAESIQVQYLTKELDLTVNEAERFWPVYRNYRAEIRNSRKGNESDQIELEEKVLNVRKKYKDDFKGILGTDNRVNKLFVAEKNFKEMLRKELIKRRLNRQGNFR